MVRLFGGAIGSLVKAALENLFQFFLPFFQMEDHFATLHNAIQIRKLSHIKSISNNANCPICEKSEETVDYALFQCAHASVAWFGSNLGFLANAHPNLNVIEW